MPPTSCSVDVDFSAYPDPTQPCLSQAASASGCSDDSDTVYDENDCLCSNTGNFILATATCLGEHTDELYASQVYNLMDENCLETETPLSVSRHEFLDAVLGTTETGPVDDSGNSSSIAGGSSSSTTTSISSSAMGTVVAQGQGNGLPGDSVKGMMAAIVLSFVVLLAVTGVICLLYFLCKRRKMRREAAAASRALDWRGYGPKGSDMKLSIDTESIAIPNKSLEEPTIEDEKAAMRSIIDVHQQEVHISPPVIQDEVLKSPYELPGYQQPIEFPGDNRVSALTIQGPLPDDGNIESWCPSPLSTTQSSSIEKNGDSPVKPGVKHLSMVLPQVTVSHVEGLGQSNTGFNRGAPFELAGDETFDGSVPKMPPAKLSSARKRGTLDTRVQRWISSINMERSPI